MNDATVVVNSLLESLDRVRGVVIWLDFTSDMPLDWDVVLYFELNIVSLRRTWAQSD
jgi:hypothetical protein